MSHILIADSGSTKTEWCLLDGKKAKKITTGGINPYFISEEECLSMLKKELKLGKAKDDIADIHFYSAGVKAPQNQKAVSKILKTHFDIKNINVHTDMLGAARATCGSEKGVTAILGTGSNSCYYDGSKISKQHPSLGYILGDEGSGTHMGRKVLQYFFYKTFDGDLHEAFINKYGNDLPGVLEKVYKEPLANRYLAGFTEFLNDHRGHYMIENIIEDTLLEFFTKNLLKYRESWKYPIHFIGSVAYTFKDVLYTVTEQYGLEVGSVMKSPIDGLKEYHSSAK
ncbi:N-acetylglucosamine kinase [Taibaiella sp. KBW10]|uniref:BadF/BadG/BcrA/BcrD ATPase family protein n=1 Tax=Taibaiella sp. KBW10 TaxID=2153357 RepID=UPI000F596663|nr:BadF/BadG/BcrA/BcrD ATPase family protein [Taibaiella sp. KBW10]RQO32210.1 N-acetylglucosamine kinase [Taibaiella sp. KBW10]